MGLDMYLSKKTYIGAEYKHRNVKGEINITIAGNKIPIRLERVSYIEERVAYWRKANHIHLWFVKNVQNGTDDCGSYSVTHESIKKLLKECEEVKLNKNVSAEILPTSSGFFFGSTDYDEYYMKGIDYTIEVCEAILMLGIDEELYYSSSW